MQTKQAAGQIHIGEKFAYGCGDLASNLVLVAALPIILCFYKLDRIYPQVMQQLTERESRSQ